LFFIEEIPYISLEEDKDYQNQCIWFSCIFFWWASGNRIKNGKDVTLSSTEVEHFRISEEATELLLIKQLLEMIGIQVKLPIIILVDNVGATFLSKNFSVGQRIQHIDIRTQYVRKYIEDDIQQNGKRIRSHLIIWRTLELLDFWDFHILETK
jgi:hypothetical protein